MTAALQGGPPHQRRFKGVYAASPPTAAAARARFHGLKSASVRPQRRSPERLTRRTRASADLPPDERAIGRRDGIGVGLKDVGQRLTQAVRNEEGAEGEGEEPEAAAAGRRRARRGRPRPRRRRDTGGASRRIPARSRPWRHPRGREGRSRSRGAPTGSDAGRACGRGHAAAPGSRGATRPRARTSAVRSISSSVWRAFTVSRSRLSSGGTAGYVTTPQRTPASKRSRPAARSVSARPATTLRIGESLETTREPVRLERRDEAARVRPEAFPQAGLLVHHAEGLRDSRADRRGKRGGEEPGVRVEPQIVDQLARADDVAARRAGGLREGAHQDVDAPGPPEQLLRAAPCRAEDARGVRLVHVEECAVPVGRLLERGQRGDRSRAC